MKKLLLIFILLTAGFVKSQSLITLLDGTPGKQHIITCDSLFRDPGGKDSDPDNSLFFYPHNVNDTITFCPDTDGKKIRFIVTDFDMEIGDVLKVFDGSSATNSNFLSTFTNVAPQGMNLVPNDTIQASTFNTEGCLTFVFISDNDDKNNKGWDFKVSCFVPCQDIIGVGNINGINAEDSIFHLCRGDELTLAGLGIYPDMGTPKELYTQANDPATQAASTFIWNIEGPTPATANGVFNPATGLSEVIHQFQDSGIYHLILEIKDTLTEFECKNRNYVHNIVYVSGPPLFTAGNTFVDTTMAEIPLICLGDTNFLVGIVDTFFHVDDCKPKSAEMKFIPDGAEVGGLKTVELDIEFKCFGKQTIQSANDIEAICINMEHSAIGDLDMSIVCPSGNTVRFLTPVVSGGFPQNGNLGDPLLSGLAQGVDSTYCFTMDALQTLNQAAIGVGTNGLVSNANALPIDSYDNLIGCRVNGIWKILIKDTRINDNGYAGEWELKFSENIQPVSDTLFYNVYADSNWVEDPTNPSLGINFTPLTRGDSLFVLPTAAGLYKYKFEVLDDFGCTYDTVVEFNVVDRKQADFIYVGDTVFCENDPTTIDPIFVPGFMNLLGESGTWTSNPPGLNLDANGKITITGSTPGTYIIQNEVVTPLTGCVDIHTAPRSITINPLPTPTITGAGTYCEVDTLSVNPDPSYASIEWSNGTTNDTLLALEGDNPISVTVVDTNGCIGTSPTETVTSIAVIQHSATITICEGASALIHGVVQTVPGVYSQSFSLGQTACDSVSEITLQFFPHVNIGPDVTICEGASTTLTAGGIDPFNANYTWNNGVFGQSQTVNPIVNTEYQVIATDGNGCVTRDTVMVLVNPIRDLGLSVPTSTICVFSPAPVPTFNAFPGYFFTSSPAGVDMNTGILTATQTGTAGTYVITYQDGLYGCDINNTVSITVTSSPNADFSYGLICIPGTTACPSFNGGSAGIFSIDQASQAGIVINQTTGCIDLVTTSAGTYTIINTIPASGVCPADVDQQTVTIHPKPVISGTVSSTNFCIGGQTSTSGVIVTEGDASVPNDISFSWSHGNPDGALFSPSTSGTYEVTGTEGATGCTNTAIVSVIVNQLPLIDPLVSDVICLGETASISAFSPNSINENISYSWDNGLGAGSNKDVTPPVTTTYIVTVTNNNTLCQNTANLTVTVNQPIIDAGQNTGICINGSVNLNANGALDYTWTDMSNGTVIGNTPSVIQSPTTTRDYRVVGTDVNGCTFEDFVTVTVNPLPIITATAVPTTVCSQSSTTITGNGGVSYTLNGSAFNNGLTTTYVPSNPGQTAIVDILNIVGTDGNGCQNNFSVPITVNPLPIVTANANDVSLCVGETLVLTGGGSQNYTWTPVVQNGVGFQPPVGVETYSVTGVDPNTNCTSAPATITVTVNDLPIVQANASDVTPCEGDLVTFTGSGSAGVAYVWNNGVVDGVATSVNTTTTTYVVTGFNAATGCSNTDEVTITVNPLPQVLAQVDDNSICEGNSVTLTATPSTFSTYSWSPTSSTESTFTDKPTTNTNYVVTVTDANGCIATSSVAVEVFVNNVEAIINANPTSGFPGLEVDFGNGSNNANFYKWEFGNDATKVETDSKANQSSTYNEIGEYVVQLIAINVINGCSDTTEIIVTVNPFDGAVVCPPNIFTPNGDGDNDLFYISLCEGIIDQLEVNVINRWGNSIHSMNGKFDPADPQTYWDGTKDGKPVSEGVYFYTYKIVGKNGDIVEGQDNIHVVRDKK